MFGEVASTSQASYDISRDLKVNVYHQSNLYVRLKELRWHSLIN